MFKNSRKNNEFKTGMVQKPDAIGTVADILIIAVLILIMFMSIIPLWHTLMSSLSDGQQLMAHEGLAWKWVTQTGLPNFRGYLKILEYNNMAIIKSYGITIVYVVGNIFFGLIINVIAAYVIYRGPKLAPFFTFMIIVTIMFNGGLLPTYMVVKSLGLVGTPWALMLPGCTNAMFVILILNAFKQVPDSTVEAAEIDGAGHFRIMFNVMLPQAIGLASVSMINTGIISWNAWFEASIYVPQNKELWPIQLWIKQIVADNQNILNSSEPDWNKYLVSYAVIIITTIPVLIVMPFAQKQLMKGGLLGAVKG